MCQLLSDCGSVGSSKKRKSYPIAVKIEAIRMAEGKG